MRVSDAKQLVVREADLAEPTDAEALVELIDAYARDPMGGGQPLPEEVRGRLVPALQQVPDRLVLLAFDGDRAVGVAVCFQGFSTFHAQPLINIHDLAVLPGCRGRGLGKALLAAVEVEARRRGCCKLTLEVRQDNPAAGLYRVLGFGAGSAGGAPIQYLFMEKRLVSGPSAD
jgi:ribosomal protein S18 acetylase RimI-like enzyme